MKKTETENTTALVIKVTIFSSIAIILAISLLQVYDKFSANDEELKKQETLQLGQTTLLNDHERELNPLGLTISKLSEDEIQDLEARSKLLDQLTENLHSPSINPSMLVQTIEESEQLLPRKEHVRELSESEVHMLPYPIAAAGEWLIDLKEFILNHPENAEKVLPYYLNCAENIEIVDTIRALCLTHFILIHEQNSSEPPIRIEDFPSNIRQLVESALSF